MERKRPKTGAWSRQGNEGKWSTHGKNGPKMARTGILGPFFIFSCFSPNSRVRPDFFRPFSDCSLGLWRGQSLRVVAVHTWRWGPAPLTHRRSQVKISWHLQAIQGGKFGGIALGPQNKSQKRSGRKSKNVCKEILAAVWSVKRGDSTPVEHVGLYVQHRNVGRDRRKNAILLAWPPLQSLAVNKKLFLSKFWAVKNF